MLKNVKVSFLGFVLGGGVNLLFLLHFDSLLWALIPLMILAILFKDYILEYVTALCLGCLFLYGVSNCISISPTITFSPFYLYISVLSFFHWSEYQVTGIGNPSSLSWDSFLINHSIQYWAAMLASWLEYLVWRSMLTGWSCPSLSLAGLALCLSGELVRKVAMLQAGRSFNHLVQTSRDNEHKLVTEGIYSVCRHPSYLGWFLWSLGSQVLLLNPLCFIAYGLVTFYFFRGRIEVEEYHLVCFFGHQYLQYQKKVPTGIPFIKGYVLEQ